MERFEHEHTGSVFLDTAEIACFHHVYAGILLIVLRSGYQVRIKWDDSIVAFAHRHFPPALDLTK